MSGGARVIEEPKDRPVEYMVTENVRKKKHIARLASKFLRDDQRISLDASSTALGTDTISQIGMHHCDIAFISCRGTTARGSYDPNDDETALKRAFAENSTHVVLLADSSKFNKTFLNVSLGYDVIDAVVSDAPLPEDIQEVCRNKEVEMLW